MVDRRFLARAAGVWAALALSPAMPAAAAGGPVFAGPTVKNPTVPPAFTLRDQAGKTVRLEEQRGRVVLLTFLYTHCLDVCPLTAEHLNLALRRIDPRQRLHVRVLAISVDPKGDTHASVERFVRLHRLLPQFRYLSGSTGTLQRIWAAYGVKSLKQAGGDRVDHTLYTLLLDRSLRARVLYDSTATSAAVSHDVRLLLPRNP